VIDRQNNAQLVIYCELDKPEDSTYLLCRYFPMEERMETRVQRWGNSLALRIPKSLADEAGLKNNSPVQLSLRDKLLVIEPVRKPALSLDALLAQVTTDNVHSEVQTGPAVGCEAW